MATVDLAKKRVVDFNPLKCGLKGDSILLFSPLDWIEGDNLYLPESIRMFDGSINEKVIYDSWSFTIALEKWEGESLSMYVGKNYLKAIDNWAKGYINDREKLLSLHLPKVVNIFLYDEEIEGCTSKNGILYYGGKAVFVPDRNPYAESIPLTPVHGMYEDSYSSICGIDLEECGKDMFGGVYSLDGKSFIRWDGHSFVKSYRIRNGVKEIREKAFRLGYGSGLSINTIYLPDTLERIGREAFMSCRLIKELSIPVNVVEIEERAFHNCQSLESVTLSPNLRIIGKEAFSSTGLKNILIPNSVLHIGNKCFDNCWQLSSIDVNDKNKFYSSEDGILYNIDKTCLIRIPPLLPPDTPDNVNERMDIESWHVEEFRSEEDGVVQYENFYEGITYVNKTDSATGKIYKEIIRREDVSIFPSINLFRYQLGKGDKVFVEDGEHVKAGTLLVSYLECESRPDWEAYYGPSRREYTIPNNVTTISAGALQRCPFKKLTIPKTVKYIGNDQYFSNAAEFVISPENEFYESRDNAIIEKKNKKLLHWFGKDKDIVIPQGVEIIGERAFDFYGFKSLVIPEGVKCIETHAFWCSIQGYTIYLPSSLCYVATDAFYDLNGQRDSYCEYNIYVPHGLKQKYVKLLDYYGAKRDIKEIESDSIDDIIEPDYKELAIVTEEDLAQAIIDEDGNKYSKDKKRFLKAESSVLHVKEGTEVICEDSIFVDDVHIPSTIRYIGIDGIFSERLVIEGKDTYIGGLYLCYLNTIYVPCGTWAMYYSLIESNMIHSKEVQCGIEEDGFEDFKEKFDEYRLVELTKANISMYLRQQRDILISIISSTEVLSEYSLISINGVTSKNFTCFRIADVAFILYLENSNFVCRFADTFFILGYTLQDVCNLLGVKIREIEINKDNKETIIGYELARRVLKSWMEDFVDEDSGEVVSIERNEVILDSGHTIEIDDVQTLLDEGLRNIVVYDENPWCTPVSCLISAFSTSEKELCVNPQKVLGLLFPEKECCELSVDEKLLMAYNLLVAFKAAGHFGCVEDVLMPFRINPEEHHTKVTSEESKLINLISDFYNQKINAIMDCNTDLDVMPLFSTDKEICNQLESFLKDNGVPEGVINSFVIQFFDALDLE